MTRLPYLPYPDLPDITERRAEMLSIRHALSRVAARIPQQSVERSVGEIQEIIKRLERYSNSVLK